MKFKCRNCGQEYDIYTRNYLCNCGGLFELKTKYSKLSNDLTLGEGNTPLLKRKIANKEVYLKLDYLQPTGSFKDRGAALLIDQLLKNNINKIVEDSSGNAGAAIAAYAAAANIDCTIYLPENTSRGKIKQIKAYGANIKKISGSRDQTAKSIKKDILRNNYYYASHVYNPLFIAGISSLAFEIYDKISIPDKIFVPVGNGTMLLGLYYAFKELGEFPQFIVAQNESCSPIYNSFYEKKKVNNRVNYSEESIAEGIAIKNPARKEEIIKAIKDSDGKVITVNQDEIRKSFDLINNLGLYIEKTSAVAPAAFIKYAKKNKIIDDKEKIVVPLTGIGLKK
ncbi:MAG: pyridoxal-phosphate dependent enzyme [Bacillota bacterium]